ncbi:unnamed protein product [Leptidea sinapis]|uniref:Uncharacterized protein n=1 Tax=Leptidea sinapis TaxID=189913 RepID=A0A5E4QDQ0_9NEOP|nr:unnamed protein product [Leptidea sinapis]
MQLVGWLLVLYIFNIIDNRLQSSTEPVPRQRRKCYYLGKREARAQPRLIEMAIGESVRSERET